MSEEGRRREGGRRGRSHGSWGWGQIDFSGAAASDAGMLLVLIILLLAGVAVLAYFVVIVFLNFLSFGEVHRASVYRSKIRRYSIDEPKGCELARGLTRMNANFAIVLFIFTAEEAIRYFLHTGPATLEIWAFRIVCLVVFGAVLGVFLVRLSKWASFKSRPEFVKASKEIRQHEEERTRMRQRESPSA